MEGTLKLRRLNTKAWLASGVSTGSTTTQRLWEFMWLAKDKKSQCVGGCYSCTKWGLINLSRAASERASDAEKAWKHLMTAGYITDYVPQKSIRRCIIATLKMTNQIWVMYYFLLERRLFPWCCKLQLFALCRWRSDHSVMAWCT